MSEMEGAGPDFVPMDNTPEKPQADVAQINPNISQTPEAIDLSADIYATAYNDPGEMLSAVLTHTYHNLQNRIVTNPIPTQAELNLGLFDEEIEVQAHDAVISLRDKGYNVILPGFEGESFDEQGFWAADGLSYTEASILEQHGFTVDGSHVTFKPENPTDLAGIKAQWNWLANLMPDLGESAPESNYPHAIQFREAHENGTLLSYYWNGRQLNMAGTKYMRRTDEPMPISQIPIESAFSTEPAAALRERVFVGQYYELKDRLATNPGPTLEELNLGTYMENLEPQVRSAILNLRSKGYNTGSSGFTGAYHDEQSMVIDGPVDERTKGYLSAFNIWVDGQGIRFRPSDPTNLDEITNTWNFIAGALPSLGTYAEPTKSENADLFRFAAQNQLYDFYLEDWIWRTGALNGLMDPLTVTLLNEGRDFGPDVDATAMDAQHRHDDMLRQFTDFK